MPLLRIVWHSSSVIFCPSVITPATRRHTGFTVDGIRMRADFERRCARTAIRQASASAEAPSYSEAFETSMPVSPAIIDWNSYMICSVPWLASAWYGV